MNLASEIFHLCDYRRVFSFALLFWPRSVSIDAPLFRFFHCLRLFHLLCELALEDQRGRWQHPEIRVENFARFLQLHLAVSGVKCADGLQAALQVLLTLRRCRLIDGHFLFRCVCACVVCDFAVVCVVWLCTAKCSIFVFVFWFLLSIPFLFCVCVCVCFGCFLFFYQ